MKKIFAFLLVFTLGVSFASAWDIDGGLAGATKVKIDMGLKNQIRHAYDNGFSVEVVLPVSDTLKLGLRVELDNDADKLDYTASNRTQTTSWSKIDDEFKIGLGLKPNDDLKLGVDFYVGVNYSEASSDANYDAYGREWYRNNRTFKSTVYGDTYFGFGVAIGLDMLPIDTLWIIQKVKVAVGEGFADGVVALPNYASNTASYKRDQFNYGKVEYDGTIKTGIPLHTMLNLDIAKLGLGIEYNYGIDYTGYVTAYTNGANPIAANINTTYTSQGYASTTGRTGMDGLPMVFGTDHNFKLNLGINYANIETNVWVKPEIDYDLKSWKWKGVKPYEQSTVNLNFYIGSDWKVSIPAQTFFPCIVSFKLGAEWKIANAWAQYSDYAAATGGTGNEGFIDNEINQTVKGRFEMEMNFNGVTATLGWSPDVHFIKEKDDAFTDGYGGIGSAADENDAAAGMKSLVTTDTNIFNLGIWKIGVSIEFDPIKKKASAVEEMEEEVEEEVVEEETTEEETTEE